MNEIPKIIHYCWFGGNRKPKLVRECIKSWKKHLPDYKIVEWNESNTDLSHPFTEKAYLKKKWAFVSDYVRLKVLYDFGGIYLDTDMMLIKSLDVFLEDKCFFGSEEQDENLISCGIIGAVKKDEFLKKCLDSYKNLELNKELEDYVITLKITNLFRKVFNFQGTFGEKIELKNIIIYPINVFYPLPFKEKENLNNYKEYIKPESFTIHLWSGSWKEYNEFKYLRNGKYLKGFKAIRKQKSFKDFNYKYVRKVLSAIKESIRF